MPKIEHNSVPLQLTIGSLSIKIGGLYSRGYLYKQISKKIYFGTYNFWLAIGEVTDQPNGRVC